jgi:hypothetical protein
MIRMTTNGFAMATDEVCGSLAWINTLKELTPVRRSLFGFKRELEIVLLILLLVTCR